MSTFADSKRDAAGRPLGAVAITGCATPAGGEVLRRLAASGAPVAAIGPQGEQLPNVLAVPADLTDRDGVSAGFESVVRAFGQIDMFVHISACQPCQRPIHEYSEEEFSSQWEHHTMATMWCLQAVFDRLAKPGGRVLVVLPTLGITGESHQVPLAASVEAQRQLAKSAARQWGQFEITVNCLLTGLEAVTEHSSEQPRDEPLIEGQPRALGYGREQDATAVADLVSLLVAGGSWGLSGSTLCVDGGSIMAP